MLSIFLVHARLVKVGGRTEYPHRKYDEYLKQWYNWGGSRQQGVKEADGIRQDAGTQSALWINFGRGEDHDGRLVQHTGQAWFRNGFDVTELPVRCELRRSHLPGTGELKRHCLQPLVARRMLTNPMRLLQCTAAGCYRSRLRKPQTLCSSTNLCDRKIISRVWKITLRSK